MQWTFTLIDRAAIQAILRWQYTGEYTLYNALLDPETADLDALSLEFFVNQHNAYAAYDEAGVLLGFCCFGVDAQVPGGNYTGPALDIGLGLRPDLTGQNLGTSFLGAILALAQREFEPMSLRATIALFNARSQRVFAKNGFQPTQHFMSHGEPPLPFVVMEREA
ncbi:MAG: GNAT family N-acetyltransferase [Chloroflexi bacterium]|nr:GNAT family N-acetyltransferase [Chloroflexota bacterium]